MARLWDLDSGKLVRALSRQGMVMMAAAFSPDGHYAAISGADGSVRIWETATGQIATSLMGHRLMVRSVAWSRDGTSLFTSSADGTLRQWETATSRQTRLIVESDRPVHDLCLSPDEQLMVSLENDGRVRGWSLAEGREVRTLHGGSAAVRDVCCSPDGLTALSTAGALGVVSDLATGKTLRILDAGPHRLARSFFLPGGREALSVSLDGHLLVWDLLSGKTTRTFDLAAPASAAALSPDGARLAVAHAGQDGHVELWDLAAGHRLDAGSLPDGGAILAIVFAPNGRSFVTAGRGVWQWGMAPLKPQRNFSQAARNALCAAFDPQGRRFVTDGTQFDLWDLESGKLLKTSRNLATGQVNATAFAPEGSQILFGGGDGDLRVMDANDPSRVRSMPTDESRLTCVTYAARRGRRSHRAWKRRCKNMGFCQTGRVPTLRAGAFQGGRGSGEGPR